MNHSPSEVIARQAFTASKSVARLRTTRRHVEQARRSLEVKTDEMHRAVVVGRQAGLSWKQIGDALGITKQAAQQMRTPDVG